MIHHPMTCIALISVGICIGIWLTNAVESAVLRKREREADRDRTRPARDPLFSQLEMYNDPYKRTLTLLELDRELDRRDVEAFLRSIR